MESAPKDISLKVNGLSRAVAVSLSLSTSPTAALQSSFQSPTSSYGGSRLAGASTGAFAKQLKPFATEDIKILLLENVNETGRDNLTKQGYQVDFHKSSLPEDELIAKIRWDTST